MKLTLNYILTNDSESDLGPLDLFALFGGNDAEPQVVVIPAGGIVTFKAEDKDCAEVQHQVVKRLRQLGSKLGSKGLVIDQRPEIIVTGNQSE